MSIAEGQKPVEKEGKLKTEDRSGIRTCLIRKEKNWEAECWWKVSFR